MQCVGHKPTLQHAEMGLCDKLIRGLKDDKGETETQVRQNKQNKKNPNKSFIT